MLATIWERYFFKELIKSCFFFLATCYGLYALVDYASHTGFFHHYGVFKWKEVVIYYTSDFFRRLDVLLPFSLLIGTIRTLCALNINHELIALRSSGISLKRLMLPFLFVGLLASLFLFFNEQFFLPKAAYELKKIEERHSRKKKKVLQQESAKNIKLKDNSTLLFHHYDETLSRFYDVYWVKNANEIYHMRYLTSGDPPVGDYVDYLKRSKEGNLVVASSEEQRAFPKIQLNDLNLFETTINPEDLAISELITKYPQNEKLSEKESELKSTLFQKLYLPWLCLFAILAPAPLCLRATRNLSVFFIYALGIFGLVAFYLMMGAAVVLGKRQVFEPFAAIWLPFSLGFTLVFWKFLRLR